MDLCSGHSERQPSPHSPQVRRPPRSVCCFGIDRRIATHKNANLLRTLVIRKSCCRTLVKRCCASSTLTPPGPLCCRTSHSMRSVWSAFDFRVEAHASVASSHAEGAGAGAQSRCIISSSNSYGCSDPRKPRSGWRLSNVHWPTPIRYVQPYSSSVRRTANGSAANEHEHAHGHGYGDADEPDASNADEHGPALRKPSCDAERHAQPEPRSDACWRAELHESWRHVRVLKLLIASLAHPFPPPSADFRTVPHLSSLRTHARTRIHRTFRS